MRVEYAGRQYAMILGSDVIHDGMFLEMNDVTVEPEETILFAFWSDADGSLTFSAYKEQLPFELVELFMHEARTRLPPEKPNELADG